MSSEAETKQSSDRTADENAQHKNAGGDGSDAGKNGHEGDEEVPVTFPQRLMDVLSDESISDIISWLPHGKGFMIKDKKRFADEVLTKYFKKSKFTSFTRKLNRWNFVRVTRGPETGSYYHQFFVKENPKLVSQMTCINSKAPQQLQPMNPVALGLGTGGQYYPDTSDPASMQRIQEQRQAFFQQQWQQQQAFMAWMAQQQQQQNAGGDKEGGDDNAEGKGEQQEGDASESRTGGDGDQKQEGCGTNQPGNNAAAMVAFQQQQYYAMFMAHQQQMAAMASGQMPNYPMNMGGSAPQNGDASAGAAGEASGSGEATGHGSTQEAPEHAKAEEPDEDVANAADV